MKLRIEEKNKLEKKQILFYTLIIIICIISIIIAFYVQFYARIDIGKMLGVVKEESLGQKTTEQLEILETDFDKIFTNSIANEEEQGENKRKDSNKDLVYTEFEKKETKLNGYDVEVHIPKINIDNPIIDEYNKNIEAFVNKTNEIIESENRNIIYTVEYVASIQEDILSLMIRSNLKEGASAQRVIIETYNYDLRNNKEISLEEVLGIEYLEEQVVQEKINNKVENEQKKVEDLKELGYNIYSRDISSDEYKIENSKYFYLANDVLYIIYPYGNENFTSEMDLVII